VQIENHKLYFGEMAQSKCGSLNYDSISRIPGGGDKKVVYVMNFTGTIKLHIFFNNWWGICECVTTEHQIWVLCLKTAEEKYAELS